MSLSPSKGIKKESLRQLLSRLPYVEELPEGRLVLAIVEKQSNSGCSDNDRLLVYNGKDHTVGYSNIFPKEIPISSFENVKYLKKTAYIMDTQITRNKTNHKAIEIKMKSYTYRKKQEAKNDKWVFKFRTISAASEMMNQLTEAQKQLVNKNTLGKEGVELQVLNQNPELKPLRNIEHFEPSIYHSDNIYAPNTALSNSKQTYLNPESQYIRTSQNYNEPIVSHEQEKVYSFGSKDGNEERKDFDNHRDSQYMKESVNSRMIESKYKDIEETDYKKPNKSSRYQLAEESPRNQNRNIKPQKLSFSPPKLDLSNLRNNYGNEDGYKNRQKYSNEFYQSLNKNFEAENKYSPNNSKYSLNNKQERKSSMEKIKEMFPGSKDSNSNQYRVTHHNPINQRHSSINYIPQSDVYRNQTNFDSRQDYVQSKRSKHNKQSPILSKSNSKYQPATDWNKEFYFSKNPISTILNFKNQSQTLIKAIIDSYTNENQQDFVPIQIEKLSTIYQQNNMVLIVGISLKDDTFSLETQHNFIDLFYDNHYLSSFFSNQDSIQIPLLNLVEYKGIVSLVKAKIIDSKQYNGEHLSRQIGKLESLTGIKRQELIRSKYRVINYNNNNVIYIDIVDKLFSYDNQVISPWLMKLFMEERSARGKSRRKEDQIVLFKNNKIDELVKSLKSTKEIILHCQDLERLLKKYGVDYQSLNFVYFRTELKFIQSIIASEVAADEARNMISYHLQRKIRILNKDNKINNSQRYPRQQLLELVTQLIENLCSHTKNSEQLWNIIGKDIKKKWGIELQEDKKDINWGYFIGALIYKLRVNVNIELLDKNKHFGREKKCINSKLIQSFQPHSRTTTVNSVEINRIIKLLEFPDQISNKNVKFVLQNFQILDHLKDHPMFSQILRLLAEFININQDSILFEQFFKYQPPSTTSVQLQTFKIHHFLTNKNQDQAIFVFQNLCELINFWGGEFHPLLSNLYDIFMEHYFKNRQFKDAISLCKSSIVNTAKLVGNELSLAYRYKRLGEAFDECSKNSDALLNYIKARDIFIMKIGTNSLEVGEMEFKIGVKHLQNSNLTQSLHCMKKALRIISELPSVNDDLLLDIFETIAKIYENQSQYDLLKQNAITCFERFSNTQQISKYSKVLKISILPFLIELDREKRRCLKEIINNIRFQYSEEQYSRYLKQHVSEESVLEEFVNVLRKIQKIRHQLKYQDEERKREKNEGRGKYDVRESGSKIQMQSQSSMTKSHQKSRSRGNIEIDAVRDVSILEAIVGIAEYEYVTQKIDEYDGN